MAWSGGVYSADQVPGPQATLEMTRSIPTLDMLGPSLVDNSILRAAPAPSNRIKLFADLHNSLHIEYARTVDERPHAPALNWDRIGIRYIGVCSFW
jgi:hypothetical protein